MKKTFVLLFLYLFTIISGQIIAQSTKRPCIKKGVLDGYSPPEKQEKYVEALENNNMSVLTIPASDILDRAVANLMIRSKREKWERDTGLTKDIALALQGSDMDLNRRIALEVFRYADIIKSNFTIDDDISFSYVDEEGYLNTERKSFYKEEMYFEWCGKIVSRLKDGCPVGDFRNYNIENNPGSHPVVRRPPVEGNGPFKKNEIVDLFKCSAFNNPGDFVYFYPDKRPIILNITKDSLVKRIIETLNFYAEKDGWVEELGFLFAVEDIHLILALSETAFHFFKKGQLEVDAVKEKGEIVTYYRDSYRDSYPELEAVGAEKAEAYLFFNPTRAFGFKKNYPDRVYLSLHDLSVVREIN